MLSTDTFIIENNCPVVLGNSKTGKNPFCKSCACTVIDCTSKSKTEIKDLYSQSNGNFCGIFKDDQVLSPKRNWTYKLMFSGLIAISFVGFNVTPIKAQSLVDTLIVGESPQINTADEEYVSEEKEVKRKSRFRISHMWPFRRLIRQGKMKMSYKEVRYL
ncbi:MAG: hypothetical protein HRT71_17955 [Flavobacteriales bacterium]|nr:hypothetical protein [Flavobacteriales bacterium]